MRQDGNDVGPVWESMIRDLGEPRRGPEEPYRW